MSTEVYDDDQVLEYTHGIRKQLVGDLTTDGMPKEREDREILLKTLDGMDRSALGNKRIKKDEKMANDDRKAQMLIGQMFKHFGNTNPFTNGGNVIDGVSRQIEIPDTLYDDVELIDGETDIGVGSESFEEFSRRTGFEE